MCPKKEIKSTKLNQGMENTEIKIKNDSIKGSGQGRN